ncbi:MAG: FAD-dependent oxidoreductase [Acidimicrobiia bacterium]|nr:FAD-dependent oxidoreductase [Acidimicrobiia bacterium]
MTERLLIVGGDAGGMSAAATARRRVPTDKLEIVAFERGSYTSYAACGLPYFVADMVPSADRLVARSPEKFRAQGIDARTGHDVVEIDLERRALRVRDTDAGTESWEPFDQLLVATGATPLRPPLPGVDAGGVHGIQTIGDGIALRSQIDTGEATRAVVVGGGYIGLEMAEAMVRRGLSVALVEMAAQPMGTLDPDIGALVADALRAMGVSVHLGTAVEGFETDAGGNVTGVATTAGTLPADVVVLGLGVRPNASLAADAGIAVGVTGGIVTDRRMATSAEGVWAAGDCVETYHRVSRRPVAIALGTHANKQGRVVGVNATGGYLAFPGVIGTAVMKVCEYEVARTGLTEREASAAAFSSVAATIDGSTRAHYYPGATPITVKVVAEKMTGRLLGAQIIGREGAAKRIDVIAAAIWNEMTAEELSQLDLGYAPPFSPVWDPVLIAARKAAEAVTDAGTTG